MKYCQMRPSKIHEFGTKLFVRDFEINLKQTKSNDCIRYRYLR